MKSPVWPETHNGAQASNKPEVILLSQVPMYSYEPHSAKVVTIYAKDSTMF